MHSSRRHFLKTGILTGTTLSLLPQLLLSCQSDQGSESTGKTAVTSAGTANKYFDHIGVQLYTLRDAFDADPEGTLKKIAEVGYKEVELHNVNLLPDYASVCKDLGLAVTSSHFTSAYVTGQWERLDAAGESRPANTSFASILAIAAERQLPYLVMPYLAPEERGDLDRYKELAAMFNQRGEECKQAGVRFCYHNHSFEFEPMGDRTPLEVLMEETDPELVDFEVDIFWVKASGNDPVAFMKKYPDRIKLLHLKDFKPGIPPSFQTEGMSERHPGAFMEVGEGSIDFTAVLKTAAEIGVTNCYVEQDQSADPLASIATSYRNLSEIGL